MASSTSARAREAEAAASERAEVEEEVEEEVEVSPPSFGDDACIGRGDIARRLCGAIPFAFGALAIAAVEDTPRGIALGAALRRRMVFMVNSSSQSGG